MKPASSTKRVLILGVAAVGLVAIILAIVGVATKQWVGAEGSTQKLNESIHRDVLPRLNGGISQILAASPSLATAINGIVNGAFQSVVENIGKNLESTTYNLFTKSTNDTKVDEFSVPQGLIIAGLCCIFVGTVLAVVVGLLGLWRVISILPLLLLVVGPVLITIGYLLYAKVVVEDFGHELGIVVHLGYSLVLIVISSIIGYATAIFFAFTILHHRRPQTHDSNVLVTGHSARNQPMQPTLEMSF